MYGGCEEGSKSFGGNGNFRIKTSRGGFIKYYGSYDTSSMKLSSPNLDDENSSDKINQNGKNTFHSLSYREKFGRYTLNLGSSYTYNQNILHFSNIDQNGTSQFNNDIDSKGNYFNAYALLESTFFLISVIMRFFLINSLNSAACKNGRNPKICSISLR